MPRFSSSQVPQADRVELLVRLVKAVAGGAETDVDIAHFLGATDYVDRQGRYYRLAAEILGLLNPVYQNRSTLTPRGKALAAAPNATEERRLLVEGVMWSPVLRAIVGELPSPGKTTVATADIAVWLVHNTDLAPSTAGRRATSVKNYLEDLGLLVAVGKGMAKKGAVPPPLVIDTVVDDTYLLLDLAEHDWSVAQPVPDVGHNAENDNDLIVSLRSRAEMERINATHEDLVARVALRARASGYRCLRNTFVDLYVHRTTTDDALFEMKTNNPENTISQVRKGVSQLYEYQYQQKLPNTPLVLVLEQEPVGPSGWAVDYLADSRLIMPVWLSDDGFGGHDFSRDGLPWLVDK